MDISRMNDIELIEKEEVYSPDDDTYLLIELIEIDGTEKVLDLGCGTGVISLLCADSGAKVTAADIDPGAVELTKENSRINDIPLETIIQSDIFSKLEGCWDVVIFNPPYLPRDKDLCFDRKWDGGREGDEIILRFLSEVKDHINTEGRIYFICSDRAPLKRINGVIGEHYEVIERSRKDYRFETIYGYALRAVDN